MNSNRLPLYSRIKHRDDPSSSGAHTTHWKPKSPNPKPLKFFPQIRRPPSGLAIGNFTYLALSLPHEENLLFPRDALQQ